jgi:formylglycine-generating enzyme required for sulfatase activity
MVGGNAPHPDSLLGKLRTLTGGVPFDLPSRAMVEYATQVNSLWRFANDGKAVNNDAAWNDDSPFVTNHLSKVKVDPNLPGTYAGNAGEIGPAQVGSFACNKAGLFDTIGNVREWCVDWHAASMKQASYTALKGAANVDLTDPTLIRSYQHTSASATPQMEGSMRYCAGSDYSVTLANGITPNYFNTGDSGLAPSSADKKTGLRLAIVIGE